MWIICQANNSYGIQGLMTLCMASYKILLSAAVKLVLKLFACKCNLLINLQKVWNQTRPDVLSGLVWIQTFCHIDNLIWIKTFCHIDGTCVPVRIFWKILIFKKSADDKKVCKITKHAKSEGLKNEIVWDIFFLLIFPHHIQEKNHLSDTLSFTWTKLYIIIRGPFSCSTQGWGLIFFHERTLGRSVRVCTSVRTHCYTREKDRDKYGSLHVIKLGCSQMPLISTFSNKLLSSLLNELCLFNPIPLRVVKN